MSNPLFSVHRNELYAAINVVRDAVDPKVKIPILENLLLEAEGDRLNIRGTNLDLSISASCPIIERLVEPYSTTVLASDLVNIVKNLPESAELKFLSGGNAHSISITSGASRFKLLTLPASDFPSIGTALETMAFSTQALRFAEVLKRVDHAIKDDKTRYYLCGTFLEPDGNKLNIVGTDGHRLAKVALTIPELCEFPPAIVPMRTTAALQKVLSASKEAECRVFINEVQIRVECADITLTSKLIDGRFPDYRRVIPPRAKQTIRANREHFIQAISRVSALSSKNTETIKLSLSASAIQLELVATDGREATEAFPVEWGGENKQIGLRAPYITAALSSITTTSFQLDLDVENAPAVFAPDNDADEVYVVMPMGLKPN